MYLFAENLSTLVYDCHDSCVYRFAMYSSLVVFQLERKDSIQFYMCVKMYQAYMTFSTTISTQECYNEADLKRNY